MSLFDEISTSDAVEVVDVRKQETKKAARVKKATAAKKEVVDLFSYVPALIAAERDSESMRRTVSDVISRVDQTSAAFTVLISDIVLLTERIRRDAPDMKKAFGYSDDLRLSAEELTELCYSAAASAGFVAFLRPDDRWLLDICAPTDPRGMLLMSELHRLRAELARNLNGLYSLLRWCRADDKLRIALANLCVALSVAPAGHAVARDIQLFSMIPLSSGDPQGDAMFAAEEWESKPDAEDAMFVAEVMEVSTDAEDDMFAALEFGNRPDAD